MQDITPIANYPLPSQASLANQYIGQKLSDLPTPAVVLDRAIITKNCDAMLNVCKELGVGFRAHVKSHKVRYAGIVSQLHFHFSSP
jgi:D-serine deaminase-like pyridoxal phosphate-dependent protein